MTKKIWLKIWNRSQKNFGKKKYRWFSPITGEIVTSYQRFLCAIQPGDKQDYQWVKFNEASV